MWIFQSVFRYFDEYQNFMKVYSFSPIVDCNNLPVKCKLNKYLTFVAANNAV